MQIDLKHNCSLYFDFILINKSLLNSSKDLLHWGNIPISSTVLHNLYDIYFPSAKFLDLGCGFGNVLYFAQNIDYDVFGVEFDSDLYNISSQKFKVLKSSILDLPNTFYYDFDVIYCYKPLKEDFEIYILSIIPLMKKGAILITPFHQIKNKSLYELQRFYYKII